jgi:hypothetical protein
MPRHSQPQASPGNTIINVSGGIVHGLGAPVHGLSMGVPTPNPSTPLSHWGHTSQTVLPNDSVSVAGSRGRRRGRGNAQRQQTQQWQQQQQWQWQRQQQQQQQQQARPVAHVDPQAQDQRNAAMPPPPVPARNDTGVSVLFHDLDLDQQNNDADDMDTTESEEPAEDGASDPNTERALKQALIQSQEAFRELQERYAAAMANAGHGSTLPDTIVAVNQFPSTASAVGQSSSIASAEGQSPSRAFVQGQTPTLPTEQTTVEPAPWAGRHAALWAQLIDPQQRESAHWNDLRFYSWLFDLDVQSRDTLTDKILRERYFMESGDATRVLGLYEFLFLPRTTLESSLNLPMAQVPVMSPTYIEQSLESDMSILNLDPEARAMIREVLQARLEERERVVAPPMPEELRNRLLNSGQ